jgi:hypothetical protein
LKVALDQTADAMPGPNQILANGLSAAERLAEIAEVLAEGPQRLLARKSSPFSADYGESSVDFSRHQSSPDDLTLWSSTHDGHFAGTPTGEPQSALGEDEGD